MSIGANDKVRIGIIGCGGIANGIDELAAGLGDHSDFAAEGIMTTDTVKKEIAVSFEIDGVECKIGGIAKGSGTSMVEVNRLIKQFDDMRKMMKMATSGKLKMPKMGFRR